VRSKIGEKANGRMERRGTIKGYTMKYLAESKKGMKNFF
jgi:hypothetical protein